MSDLLNKLLNEKNISLNEKNTNKEIIYTIIHKKITNNKIIDMLHSENVINPIIFNTKSHTINIINKHGKVEI